MDYIIKEVEERLKQLQASDGELQEEESTKPFTVRLPIELIEQLDDVASVLQMKKPALARMILTNGLQSIVEKFNMKFEKHGMSFEDMYALETGEKVLSDIIDLPEEGSND